MNFEAGQLVPDCPPWWAQAPRPAPYLGRWLMGHWGGERPRRCPGGLARI